jgi:hypothetical protein
MNITDWNAVSLAKYEKPHFRKKSLEKWVAGSSRVESWCGG